MGIPFDELPYIQWLDDSGQARQLRPSVMTSETVSLESDVTEHPVEGGVDITDHISVKPAALTLELFFTDTVSRQDILGPKFPDLLEKELDIPDPPGNGLFATATSTTNLINAAVGLFASKKIYHAQYFDRPNKPRILEAVEVLDDLRNKGTLVSVKTSNFGLYEELVIQIVTLVSDNTTGKNGGKISLNLKRIRFVQSDITLALPIGPVRTQTKKDAGKGGKTVEPPKSSSLKKTSDASGLTRPGSGL